MKLLIAVVLLISCALPEKKDSKDGIRLLEKDFVSGVRSFNIPGLQLSYAENMQAIATTKTLNSEEVFFKDIFKRAAAIDPSLLTIQDKNNYELIRYETGLHLERIRLEKNWNEHIPDSTGGGLYKLPGGKDWYKYYLKRWLGAEVSPDEIYRFGLGEVEHVKNKINRIREESGMDENQFYSFLNDSSFFIRDEKSIEAELELVKSTVLQNLPKLFHDKKIPDVTIRRGTNEALSQTPGYYNDNTFFFNLFNKPYNKRQLAWLFIHEAIPGHHYQGSIENTLKLSPVQQLSWYPGYGEGWGAYVENYGKELGVYKSIYDEMGACEWDIVRSVRVPLDVGINYYGWTDSTALVFWKKNIRNQDDIAMREIARVRRWPAQVITYKFGSAKMLEWKQKLMSKKGKDFDIRNFHDKILETGPMPFFILEKIVLS